ncbi:MAG: 5'-3' exonuclease [Cetobacterium sp.]
MKRTIMLLDENGMFVRAALGGAKYLTLRSGEHIGGVFTMINSILTLVEEFRPDYIISCADAPRDTLKRREIYPKYKANRDKKPSCPIEDFKFQKDCVKAFFDVFKIGRLGADGFEADDVIASLVTKYKDTHNIVVVSGDKDMFQLLDDNVKIVQYGKYTDDHKHVVIEDMNSAGAVFGVNPAFSPCYQALTGDVADNIPGIKGVGDTSAKKMINKYHTIENIFKNLDDPELFQTKKGEPNALKKKMEYVLTQEEIDDMNLPNGRIVKNAFDLAIISRELTSLVKDIDFNGNEEKLLEPFFQKIDKLELKKYFEQLEFETFILKMGL